MLTKKTQGTMEFDYTGISSWDYEEEKPADHNIRIRKLQGPADGDRVGKEEPIEASRHDQIMQIMFCSLFLILVWYVC
jgi:hypothetical protein